MTEEIICKALAVVALLAVWGIVTEGRIRSGCTIRGPMTKPADGKTVLPRGQSSNHPPVDDPT